MADRDPILVEAWKRAGGAKALADALNIRVSAIYQWRRVPAERVHAVASASSMTPAELRPDLFAQRAA